MSGSFSQRVDEAQKIYQQLNDIIEGDTKLWWAESRCWWMLRSKKLYKLVHGIDEVELDKAWKSFVAEEGVPLSTANYKIAMYDFYIEEMGYEYEEMNKYNVRKLYEIKKVANTKEEVDKLLPFADSLSLSDFFEFMKSGSYKKELEDEPQEFNDRVK